MNAGIFLSRKRMRAGNKKGLFLIISYGHLNLSARFVPLPSQT